jgi:hypothetical protein
MNTSSDPRTYPDIKIYLEEEDFIASLITAVKSLIYAEEMLKKKSYTNSRIDPVNKEFFLEPNKHEDDFKNNVRLLLRKHNEEVREKIMEEVRQELFLIQYIPIPFKEGDGEQPINSL